MATPDDERALLWVLNQSDGRSSLLDIAVRSGLSYATVERAAERLERAKLLATSSKRADAQPSAWSRGGRKPGAPATVRYVGRPTATNAEMNAWKRHGGFARASNRRSRGIHAQGWVALPGGSRLQPVSPMLKSGDRVEVRAAAETMATLDDDGSLAAMPFMPEMLQYAGRRFTVSQRVEKIRGVAGSRTAPGFCL